MPELPEVETLRRSLLPHARGRRIVAVETRRRDLRFPLPRALSRRLAGARIEEMSRKGKYLLFHLSRGRTQEEARLLVHLGMSGNLRLRPPAANASPPPLPPHAHVIFSLEGGTDMVYTDARRFGFMDLFAAADIARNRYLMRLGPDPLTDGLDAEILRPPLSARKSPIKNALMDQNLIAGLGNIYCCEALFRAGIAPTRVASSLGGRRASQRERLQRLLDAVSATLRDALEAGGSSIRDYRDAYGESGYFQHRFQVYGRAGEPCIKPDCGGTVRRIVQANRATFFCPRCQK